MDYFKNILTINLINQNQNLQKYKANYLCFLFVEVKYEPLHHLERNLEQIHWQAPNEQLT